MSLRSLKEAARRDLHDAMQVPSYCYPKGGKMALAVSPRYHTEFGLLGDVAGTSFIYAGRLDEKQPEVIFLREQYEPGNGDVLMVSPDEGYKIDATYPPYNITQAAKVAPLPPARRSQFMAPPPGGVYSTIKDLPILAYSTMRGLLGTSG